MLCLIDNSTDPYFNLAAEEYLLTAYDKPIFRLWRNSPCIVIGKYQNALAEINHEYVRPNGIKVVRRLSGGGAVFHDSGNINFTFIDKRLKGEDTNEMFRRFTSPILSALKNIGIEARLEGRNDLTIGGKKFSGNAICLHKDRILQHGTLLFSSSMANLSGALNARPEKFIGKNVQSNVSRVTNISEHLPENSQMDVAQFINYLEKFITKINDNGIWERYDYSEKDLEAIHKLRDEKYTSDEWIFGNSPKYDFQHTFKLPCGLFDVFLKVDEGKITDCHIAGDYFFLRPSEDISNALIGTRHNYEAIISALKQFDLKDYFGADIAEEFTNNII